MKCTNDQCVSRLPGAAPIDRDANAVLNIAHRVLAAWLDPEGKSSSALRRPELVSSGAAAVSAAAPKADGIAAEAMVHLLAELDAEADDCPDQVIESVVPVAAAVSVAAAAAALV